MAIGNTMRVLSSFVTVAVAFVDQPNAPFGFLASKQKALSEMKQKTATLKTEVTKNAPHLPDESAVLTTETAVFHSFQVKANSLMKRLAVAEEEGGEALKDSKDKYEATLKTQHEQNLAMERKNEEIADEITVLYDTIAELRSGVAQLTKTNEGQTAELKNLRQNFTTAQEFVENAVNDAMGELAYSTPELQVLGELDQQDAAEHQAREHENYLRGVATAGSKLSFLQLDTFQNLAVDSSMDSLVRHHLESRSGPKKDVYSVEQIVNELTETLEDLETAQNASDVQLRNEFEEEYKKGEETYQALLQLQTELYASRDAAVELKGRVVEAKDHLLQAYETLSGQTKAVKQFSYQVGAGEKVAALLQDGNQNAKKMDVK